MTPKLFLLENLSELLCIRRSYLISGLANRVSLNQTRGVLTMIGAPTRLSNVLSNVDASRVGAASM